MATVLHNRTHNFTVVHLSNVLGNGLDEFMNPLMQTDPVGAWGQSKIGQLFPCIDDATTPEDECQSTSFAVPS
jgi:hypothetical protein